MIKHPVPKVKQPKKLKVNDVEYVLLSKYKIISDNPPISEGPFYDSVPADEKYMFTPDLGFLMGQTEVPFIMHRFFKVPSTI